MPLSKGKSKKAFSKNVETEMKSGKPQGQALAIAYNMKKRAKKARGGYASMSPGYGVECAAEGGEINLPHPKDRQDTGTSAVGHLVRAAQYESQNEGDKKREIAKQIHQKRLTELKSQKTGYFAEGGPVDPIPDSRLQSKAHQCEMCGHTSSNEEHEYDRHDDKGEPMMAKGGWTGKPFDPGKEYTSKRYAESIKQSQSSPYFGVGEMSKYAEEQNKRHREGWANTAKNLAKESLSREKAIESGYKKSRMAEGGSVGPITEQNTDNYNSPSTAMHQTHDGDVDPQDTMTMKHQGNDVKPNDSAMSEDSRKLNQHGMHEQGRYGNEGRYAEGGQITDNYADTEDGDGLDMVGQIMAQRQMEYAEGGVAKYRGELNQKPVTVEVRRPSHQNPGPAIKSSESMEDYKKRVGHYSKGGQVANDTDRDKDMEDPRDDAGSGRYDDLVNRDDDMEDADYTGANSGDELSDEREDYDRKDMVSKIMKSRKKKDRLPNPR